MEVKVTMCAMFLSQEPKYAPTEVDAAPMEEAKVCTLKYFSEQTIISLNKVIFIVFSKY